MAFKINFSTGTFYKLKIPLKKWVKILRGLDIDGVELTFKTWEEFEEVLGCEELIRFLSRYDSNTIHAPFGLVYGEGFEKQLFELERLVDLVGAKFVVFHLYNFSDLDLIRCIGFDFTLENTVGGGWNGEKFVGFVGDSIYCVTLDTSHALNFSLFELSFLFKHLKDRLVSVHLSNVVDGVHHKQFCFHPNDWFKVGWIFGEMSSDVLVTIEENFVSVFDIAKEINFVRKKIEGELK